MEKGPDHGLGHGAVGDHPLPEGAHRHQVPGGQPQHLPGGLAHLQDLAGVAVTATTDGSWRRIPRPRTATSTEVVPRSMAMARAKPPCPCLSISSRPFLCLSVNRVYSKRKEGFPADFGSCGSEECNLMESRWFTGGYPMVEYLEVTSGAQRPVSDARPRRGPFEGPSGPAQGGPCNVVSPADSSGEPGFLWKKAEGNHQGGERFLSALDPPLSSFARQEVVFILPGLRPCIPRP